MHEQRATHARPNTLTSRDLQLFLDHVQAEVVSVQAAQFEHLRYGTYYAQRGSKQGRPQTQGHSALVAIHDLCCVHYGMILTHISALSFETAARIYVARCQLA